MSIKSISQTFREIKIIKNALGLSRRSFFEEKK